MTHLRVTPAQQQVLQPGHGRSRGRYVPSRADEVLWGRLPNRDSEPAALVHSGAVVTMDTISHEGVLEDQGKDPVSFFESYGVPHAHVLTDAIEVAARTRHEGEGPHVVTAPIAVRGAEAGDVLRVDVLELPLRVPYGVVSDRHDSSGEISVFTSVERSRSRLRGRLAGKVRAGFELSPFMGIMGVARDTAAPVDSVPPTEAGGNLDISELTVGSTLYLPVQVRGALFFAGDPHMARGDEEGARTAMEGSLRPTFRLTVVKKGSVGAPEAAFSSPVAEDQDHWITIDSATGSHEKVRKSDVA